MQFSSIGSIQNHVKSMELQIKWQQKQKNPHLQATNESAVTAQTPQGGKYNAFAIEQKLKTGQQLTSEEINYLRGSYPDLYEQAVDAEKERQSYKSMLSGCQTKEDVMQANMHRVAALHDEITSVQNDPNISGGEKFKRSVGIHMKSQAVSDEHAAFQKSGEYQKLPTEQELRDKEKAAEQQEETELETAKSNETEHTEETTPQTDDHTDEVSEPNADSGETGDIKAPPVSESEAPQPAPQSEIPEAVAPQAVHAPSIPYGYAHGRGTIQGLGMDVGV